MIYTPPQHKFFKFYDDENNMQLKYLIVHV